MSEDRDCDVQDWCTHSVQEWPAQPFVRRVVEQVRRKERIRQAQRHAAVVVALFGGGVLLPQLLVPLNKLAALPVRAMADWPWVLPLAAGLCWGVHRARSRGFLRGR